VNNILKLDSFIKNAKTIAISACGEPLLSPNLPLVLEHIYSLNHRKELIAITTNGTLLSPGIYKMLDGHLADLTISLNAGTPETYNRDMVGGNWYETFWAIQRFQCALEEKDAHKVCLHMVAHTENYTEIPILVKHAHNLGISRVRVDQIMIADKKQAHLSLLNVAEDYKRIAKENRYVMFGTEATNKCLSPFNEFHVWADGRVAPCCYNGSLFMGNAYEASVEEVWNGERYRKLCQSPAKQCVTCPKVSLFENPDYHIYPLLREAM
jgi:MoaA/NifB/PqqE/SkfB family radical SAM enzyme